MLEKDLKKFTVGKGTIQFEMDKPFPKPLLKKILLTRLQQINDSYPKKSGVFIEYYKNGGIKAKGKYKGKSMHGNWEFFRLDGSLMRSGSFTNGEQSGLWITFDAKGRKVKETKF
jgi:antitoxin component YwqK of YwqJK toxin-antitoxin module